MSEVSNCGAILLDSTVNGGAIGQTALLGFHENCIGHSANEDEISFSVFMNHYM